MIANRKDEDRLYGHTGMLLLENFGHQGTALYHWDPGQNKGEENAFELTAEYGITEERRLARCCCKGEGRLKV
jgi:hypothetical protein